MEYLNKIRVLGILSSFLISVDSFALSQVKTQISGKKIGSSTATAAAAKLEVTPSSNFTTVVSAAKYYQYELYEGKQPEQTIDLSVSPVYADEHLKFTSLFNYSNNETDHTQSSPDDPLFTLSSIPKNLSSTLKGRYFMTGTVGLSNTSKDVKGQYGTLGPGVGLVLDSERLRLPWLTLSTSLSLSKAFQKSELTTKNESNADWISLSTTNFILKKNDFSATFVFMFINSLKYDHDFSNVYLFVQEAGYSFNKTFGMAAGHVNKAKTLDQTTGEFNIRVLNNETSYFYLRLDVTI